MDKTLQDPARRRALTHGLALGLAAAGVKSVRAQSADFPNRVIKFILPFPAGGTLDSLGRQVANRLAPRFGQPIIIESRPGANTQIGATYVAKAPADGYTILLGSDAARAVRSVPASGSGEVGLVGEQARRKIATLSTSCACAARRRTRRAGFILGT